MKVTILTDNTVLHSKNLLAEHGLSYFIETQSAKMLFDMGHTDVFLRNAFNLGIDLRELDYIVFSHGHYDHMGGLINYYNFLRNSVKSFINVKYPTFISHPSIFDEKYHDTILEIGCYVSEGSVHKSFNTVLTREPHWLTNEILFLGEIPRVNDFEGKTTLGKVKRNNHVIDDDIIEDSALVYLNQESMVIITGCSHSGICNIVSYAIEILGEKPIKNIIGGFHLSISELERINKTGMFLKNTNVEKVTPCHCTDYYARAVLSKYVKVDYVGSGWTEEY